MAKEEVARIVLCLAVSAAMLAVTANFVVPADRSSLNLADVANVPEGEMPLRNWTVAIYWAADNNLDEYADYYVDLWIEELTNREDIAVCVFIDRLELPANISTITEEGWTEIADLGEVNSSSPETLSSFIEYALTEPALASENFLLIIEDHGDGYLGLCGDDGLPDSDVPEAWMSIDGLGAGIRSALSSTGKSIDVIAFDACTLATIEVVYELMGTASYVVASEMSVPYDGLNYAALLSGLSDNPGISPLDLACKLVDDYEAWYTAPLHTLPTWNPYLQDRVALSVIDLNALDPLVDAFKAFTDAVLPKDNSLGMYMKAAAMKADPDIWVNTMGYWFYPDIRTMFSILGESVRTSHPEVASACDDIIEAADTAIIHDWASWRTRGIVTGLSVFVTTSVGLYEAYWDVFGRAYDTLALDFVDNSGWDIVQETYFWTNKQYGDPSVL